MKTIINLNESTRCFDDAQNAIDCLRDKRELIMIQTLDTKQVCLYAWHSVNPIMPTINPAINCNLYIDEELVIDAHVLCYDDVSEPINIILYKAIDKHPELEPLLKDFIVTQEIMYDLIDGERVEDYDEYDADCEFASGE